MIDRQIDAHGTDAHARSASRSASTILAAGLALQEAGVMPANVDVRAVVDDLIDPRYLSKATN